MAEATIRDEFQPGLVQRNDFLLRRIHSLLGIVPLALFMLEHMFTNMKATQGPEAYHGAIDFLTSLPGLYIIEFAFILLPLYFHALWGLYIWATGRANVGRYGYAANWRYTFQRWTGVLVLIFVTYHLLHWRFGVRFPWNESGWDVVKYNTIDGHPQSFFAAMNAEFQHAWMWVIYVAGLALTMYHLANGLWTFTITWGFTRSQGAQRRWGYLCAMLGVALFAAGVFGLVGLTKGEPMGVIQPVKDSGPQRLQITAPPIETIDQTQRLKAPAHGHNHSVPSE